MKVTVSWRSGESDTHSGHKLIVTQVYSSYDIADIDKVAEHMKKTYGGFLATYELEGEQE